MTGENRDGDDDAEAATVLLVDDEQSVLETYELYLETEGYDVVTATNGGEALVELDEAVDVVLLDRRMPGMSGDEVLGHVRDWGLDCRVAMITAVDPDSDIVGMGFDDYLTKPISKDKLVEQLLLFERYEELLSEYHVVTKTYATLKSHLGVGVQSNADLQALADRRDQLRADIGDTIDSFTDDDIADVFADAHAARES
jgi:DNA-binding response OmpR family regulator